MCWSGGVWSDVGITHVAGQPPRYIYTTRTNCCALTTLQGHPIGATGVAQCCELNWQLRGEAGNRQVDGAATALQHNLGLPGNVVVTMYQRPEEWAGIAPKRAETGAMNFEAATKCRL